MLIAGLDPGAKGAIVVVNERIEIQEMFFSANADCVREAWKKFRAYDLFFMVEEVHALYGASAAATFGFGRNYGEALGAIKALNLGYDLVQPKTWQAKFHKPYLEIKDAKARTKLAVKDVFPEVSFHGGKGHRFHDGAADAALIAAYGVKHAV